MRGSGGRINGFKRLGPEEQKRLIKVYLTDDAVSFAGLAQRFGISVSGVRDFLLKKEVIVKSANGKYIRNPDYEPTVS